MNDDKLRGSDPDYTAGVLLAKDLNGNIYILDSYEFQLESRNLINEIINTAARDKSDVQYIELDGSTGKNFGLLIIDELNRRGFTTGTVTQEKIKLTVQEEFQQIFRRTEYFWLGRIEQGLRKNEPWNFWKKLQHILMKLFMMIV